MEHFPAPLEKLVEQFARLPGIGGKSAQRLAFFVLGLPEEEAREFADAILDAKRSVTCCPVCQNFTAGGLCPICASPKRDGSTICVVADPRDVAAMERSREYGMELDDYLRQFFGTNEEGLDALCRENAQDSVKRDLVMYGILRAENLEITQEDLEACKPDWLITYGYEREAPKGWEDPGVQESLRAMAALRKAQEFVYEHAEPQSA